MARVTSLAVHRNTLAKRRSREISKRIQSDGRAAHVHMGGRMKGYCLVTWSDDGTNFCVWEGQASLGAISVEDFVTSTLRASMAKNAARKLISPEPDEGA